MSARKSGTKNVEKRKVKKKATAAATSPPFLRTLASAPTRSDVDNELTIYWDAYSPLNLAGVRQACANGNSLADIGVGEDDAVTFINKYNSIILRGPGAGPLVTSAEARDWDSEKMSAVIEAVSKRSQP